MKLPFKIISITPRCGLSIEFNEFKFSTNSPMTCHASLVSKINFEVTGSGKFHLVEVSEASNRETEIKC